MKNFLKTFVITLKNNIRSIESSNKTIYSALKHGMVDVQKFTATDMIVLNLSKVAQLIFLAIPKRLMAWRQSKPMNTLKRCNPH